MHNVRTAFFIALVSAGILGLLAAPSLGADPGEKEVIGTHIGSEAKKVVPFGMTLVPAGKVQLGLTADEVKELAGGQKGLLDNLSRSYPKHTVKVEPIYCDLFEVTNEQWAHYLQVTGQTPSKYLVEFAWKGQESFPEREAKLPIRNVSLREAREFARWCGKRIPTEEEWMRAAAGDDGRIYAWGNDWNQGKHCTNRRRPTLSPVGSFPSGVSPFNIHDMTASIWEWTVTKFQQYDKYKPIEIKIGRTKVQSQPGFNAQQYVVKGGHYLAGELANRLAIREAALPSDSVDSVGFRCIKDALPGMTMYHYAKRDLEGSALDGIDCDLKKIYAIEITDYTDTEPPLISGYDCLMVAPSAKLNTTVNKITKSSPDQPQPIGAIHLNRPLEEPNLPKGSYVIAYRHNGLSADDKKSQQQKEEDKKRKEQIKKIEEELKRRAEERERLKREKGISINKEDVAADKEELARLEEIKKEDEEIKRKEAERRAELEKIGLITSAKEHIDFPRDKNLIVFMNANDTIVGYVEVAAIMEEVGAQGVDVTHNPETGATDLAMRIGVMPNKIALLNFSVKIADNPF
jgi:formylglycine-generating enzyme required for sulfatase activity